MVASMVKVVISRFHDPWLNQALETHLFDELAPEERLLFLYRNSPAVVIGRYQNPWLECRREEMNRDQVALVRRISGGGAVYHDEGNLNFCFMNASDQLLKERQLEIVLSVLKRLQVPDGRMNERHDLLLAGKKISGSAFRQVRKRSLHHGTLLVHADLKALEKYLNPSFHTQGRINRALGTKSVRSVVTNIREYLPQLNMDDLYPLFIEAYFQEYAPSLLPSERVVEEISERGALESQSSVWQNYKRFKDPDWSHGQTPKFFQAFSLKRGDGEYQGEVVVDKGRISRLEIHSGPLSEMDQNWSTRLQTISEGLLYEGPNETLQTLRELAQGLT